MAQKKAQRSWRSTDKEESVLISGSELVGYYSMNQVKTYLPNASKLTYYKPPRHEDVYFDLNKGLEWAIRRDYSSGDSRLLFKWIESNYKTIEASPETGRWLEPNFICTSGLLNMLLSARSSNENWAICAARRRGNIYLSFGHRKFGAYYRPDPEKEALLASWLYKFERYVVSDYANEAPDPSKVVVEPDMFKCVYKARFGEHTVLFDVPRKAVRSDIQLSDPLPLENLKFALIRLEEIDHNAKDSLKPRKLNKWWSIAYLTNSEEVLCGFRNNAGIVKKVKKYSLQEIVDKGRFFFSPETCVNYCTSVLSQIAETMVDDDTIFEFEQIPHHPELIVKEIKGNMYYTVIPAYFDIP